MVLGGQTGGFNSSSFVGGNYPSSPRGAESKQAINRVSPSRPGTVTPNKTAKPAEQAVNEFIDKTAELKQDQKAQDKTKHEKAVHNDTFNSRVEAGKSRSEVLMQQVAAKFANDKELKKQKAENFADDVNNTELQGKEGKAAKGALKADKDQVLASHVSQSQSESIDPDAKSKKKLDEKLQRIFTVGGDKGKHFVSFVQREMTKGPLSKSILELVDGFLETLAPKDSLTPSKMIQEGNEPLVVLRGMVSANDTDEQGKIRDSLSTAVGTSAGEKTDLLAIRNLIKIESKQVPPSPVGISASPNQFKDAAEFVISINRGSITAPWDKPKKVA